ncbi:MAG: hypothetical protein JW837_18110 [Sedimentisphaerales bacterium]|nr:hypothetical protein [Sedimentisphaerales bacterium]
MLNELFELAQSQKKASITNKESRHGKYNPCPKRTTIKVLLDNDGNVTDFEVINDISQVKAIWKYEPANGQSFPAFNIKPLYWAGTDELRQKIKDIKKNLEIGQKVNSIDNVVTTSSTLWDKRAGEKVEKCFQLAEQCISIINEPPKEMSSIAVLAKRAAKCTTESLFNGIRDAAIQKIRKGDETTKGWLDKVIFCTTEKKTGAKDISVVLELSDRSAYEYPPTHDKVQRWLNSRLMEMEIEIERTNMEFLSDLDAFGETATGANAKKFPPADLPRLGRVIIRAMNSESPCQRRYKRADAASFCVGRNMRQTMKDSLEWLGKEERKNLTWRDVSGVCGFTKRNGKTVPIPGVLFAYPLNLIATLPPIPIIFAGEEGESDVDGSRFAVAAKRVVDGLSGILREQPDAEIRVFVLTKADKARTKLLLSKCYTATRISKGAEEWQTGADNIPRICINVGTGKKEKANWITPLTPFPTEVVSCLNVVWNHEGLRAKQVPEVSVAEGLSLLLDESPYMESTASHLLQRAIRNTATLLLALGHSDHRCDGSFTWNKNTKSQAKYANLLPCIFGLLLDKLKYKKGDYMHTAPFLVGQMMSLADTLHKEYCRKVRAKRKEDVTAEKNDGKESSISGLPRQLIGNAAMSIAMDNPIEGLSRLGERILIYQSWANTASGDIGFAGWALGEFRRVSEELGKLTLSEESTDADKAQMLLGYLSRIGDQKANNDQLTSTESEE